MSATPPQKRPPGARRGEPPWWVRDVLIALLIGAILLVGQAVLDDARSDRERLAAVSRDQFQTRIENLRFVRDRSSATLVERPFQHMDLTLQNMSGLTLTEANFTGSELEVADFNDADLRGVNLSETYLDYADFSGADVSCSVRDGADDDPLRICSSFVGASARSARFLETDLQYADFTDASFSEADFSGADLRHTNFADAYYFHICWDNATRWPTDFEPPDDKDACRAE